MAIARSGSSSMRSATRDRRRGGCARSGRPPRTTRSPTGSGPASASPAIDLDVRAHLAQHVDDRQARGVEADVAAARARRPDGAPPRPARPPPTRCRRAPSSDRAREAGRARRWWCAGRRGATGAPSQPSSRSVWSRVGPGVVDRRSCPSAASAASVTAPSTCALATGRSCSQRARAAARRAMRSGACPSVVSTAAPIRRSGAATRSIGRPRERRVADQRAAAPGGLPARPRAGACSCRSCRSRACSPPGPAAWRASGVPPPRDAVAHDAVASTPVLDRAQRRAARRR